MKYLYKFESIDAFFQFFNTLNKTDWRIERQLLKDRALYYSKKTCILDMKNRFIARELSIWELKMEEVITWMDTLLILSRVLFELKTLLSGDENLNIIMEYLIPYGNYMRCDYLLTFKRKIIVIEFGMFNQDEKRGEERYTKKLLETIAYRQLLQNQISQKVLVINYVMIYKPEYDRSCNEKMEENIKYNEREIRKMSYFLLKNLKEEMESDAFNQLLNIK